LDGPHGWSSVRGRVGGSVLRARACQQARNDQGGDGELRS
jgi:hypothetical protein